jgi:hypothetical protein
MELTRTDLDRPAGSGRVRVRGEVKYQSGGPPEVYWFEVPERCAPFLSTSGNLWLVALLPLAATLGEPLRICLPVDRTLFEGAQEVTRVWECWFSGARSRSANTAGVNVAPHPVSIEADTLQADDQTPGRVASFFSGGVDSFFTLLSHSDPSHPAGEIPIDDLLCVWGLDVPLTNPTAFGRMRDTLQRAADEIGKELIDISTNIRETRFGLVDWGYMGHGCALISAAFVLEQRFRKLLIPSAGGYHDLAPWGTHPLTDPLLSTRRTQAIHDGAACNRVEKTHYISQSALAMRSLRVCWRSQSDQNCGVCEKCYRTMITLALLGALERCSTFPGSKVETDKVARIYCGDGHIIERYQDIRELAVAKGRTDLTKAIDYCMHRTLRIKKWRAVARSFDTTPLAWRWSEKVERALLAGSIV